VRRFAGLKGELPPIHLQRDPLDLSHFFHQIAPPFTAESAVLDAAKQYVRLVANGRVAAPFRNRDAAKDRVPFAFSFGTPGYVQRNTSAIMAPDIGVSSDGLRMKVLPAASASAIFFIDSKNGELNGAIPAITPSGRRTDIEICPGRVIGMVSPY
jgi:hypothetical protein